MASQLSRREEQQADYRELVAASSPFQGAAGWYVAAIDLLLSEGHGPAATEHIKEKLLEGDTYRQKTEVNASSLAHRFSSLLGLKVLLSESLDAIEQHRSAAMCALEELGSRTRQSQPAPEFVEQAGQCGRCRSGPVRALVCEHCRLDERFIKWEVRLFALYSRALTAGATVTAEEAARRAQAAMVRWAGRGGLHEEQGAMSAELAEEGTLLGGPIEVNTFITVLTLPSTAPPPPTRPGQLSSAQRSTAQLSADQPSSATHSSAQHSAA